MKRLFPALALATLSFTSLLQAQLVHLTLQGTVTQQFGGDLWSPGGSGAGQPATLDIVYRAAPASMDSAPLGPAPGGGGAAHDLDPTLSSWRLRYGQLDLSGAFDSILLTDTSLWFDRFDPSTLTSLNAKLQFASPFTSEEAPLPPFPPLAPKSPEGGLTGYTSTFSFDTANAGGLGDGSIVVGIDQLTAETGPVGSAVPEPSTYGLAGALLVGIIALARRKVSP